MRPLSFRKCFCFFFFFFKYRTVCATIRVCVFSECNCHGKAEECYFDQRVADLSLSLDIRGQRRGGGVCVGCRDYTAGTNCETCIPGFYRPVGVETILWLVTYVLCLCKLHVTPFLPVQVSADEDNPCIPCSCDSNGAVKQSCVPDSDQATPSRRQLVMSLNSL